MKKVLVVEDDESSQYFMQIALEDMGLKFVIASNGQEAIDRLKKEEFGLVLMDIRLPEINGYDATRIIRQELGLRVPVIAVSAHAMEWVPEKCLEAGMNGFISKPVELDKLKDIIQQYIVSVT